MLKEIQIRTSPQAAADEEALRHEAARALGIKVSDINDIAVVRRSIDARRAPVKINLTLSVASGEDVRAGLRRADEDFKTVPADAPSAIIVGAGPAGLFAALECISRGVRPIVLERGRPVEKRILDLAAISRRGIVDPDSNYCFGEGGAGAFSDGKLFTRSKKRGDNDRILRLFVQFGASDKILREAHPHIGSDRLPKVIRNIRSQILSSGGEVRFETRVSDLIIENGEVKGVKTAGGDDFYGPVILATGHSARDVYELLHRRGIDLEKKGLAIGVRLEHEQHTIDMIQYHTKEGRGQWLPPAEYRYVAQAGGRGVYSFCMCPGGVIVPAMSAPGESVVNGMSASARAGRLANSGMVVEIRPGDFPEFGRYGELEMMELQRSLEKRFYEAAGGSLRAPAQRMKDFIERKTSTDFPPTSYAPGLVSAPLHDLLPPFIADRLRAGFLEFGRRSPGFLTDKACMIGLESRTSSPVRIPRDKVTLRHVSTAGLFPAGEGAGYAGGIVSAAIDGIRAAESCCRMLVGPQGDTSPDNTL